MQKLVGLKKKWQEFGIAKKFSISQFKKIRMKQTPKER